MFFWYGLQGIALVFILVGGIAAIIEIADNLYEKREKRLIAIRAKERREENGKQSNPGR